MSVKIGEKLKSAFSRLRYGNKPASAPREYCEVRFYKGVKPDNGDRGWCMSYEGKIVAGPHKRKKDALKVARNICQGLAAAGKLVELRVCNLKGHYTEEGSTYGEDPVRSDG